MKRLSSLSCLVAVTVLCLSLASPAAALDCNAPGVTCTSNFTGGYAKVISNAGYDYVPSIMWDVNKYKMWWCSDGGQYGDRIYYAESADLVNWTNKQEVFHAAGYPNAATNCTSSSSFDCTLVCDPSVVKVDGTYYMYYGGFPVHSDPNIQNRVGLATSSDGKNWTRANGGSPILVGKYSGGYGAGHPSVLYLGGKFYMTYTDTSAGQGQFAIRSTDPTFQTNVEELSASGWVSLSSGTPPVRNFQYVEHTQNVDWAYIDSLKQFVLGIASHDDTPYPGARNTRYVHFRFFDESLLTEVSDITFLHTQNDPNDYPSVWLEGGGIARHSNGHALQNSDCSKIHLHMIRPSDMEGTPGSTQYNDCWNNQFVDETSPTPPNIVWRSCWELGRIGWDYNTGLTSCPSVPLDYNGDSMSDHIVFRPSNATLYIRKSGEGSTNTTIGTSSSIPISGDFDGDGRADRAYAQPNGNYLDWTIYCSSGACSCPQAGCSTGTWYQPTWGYGPAYSTPDQIAIGDYDNDGKDDIAVFRASTSQWWIQKAVGW